MISQVRVVSSPIADAVWQGLTCSPKSLPPWLFYDRLGSELFEEITKLPEYYLTRTEHRIFEKHADDIVDCAGTALTLIELGAGTATKTSTVISAMLRRQEAVTFYPVDVSADALRVAVQHLGRKYDRLTVVPLVADYTTGVAELQEIGGRKLILYIGSSIGNFEPLQAAAMLTRIRRSLAPGDALIVGTDMVKDESVMLPAYDDAEGVTARFNLNLLARINRELGANFKGDCFRHVALWNAGESRIEMHIESRADQVVSIRELGLSVRFKAGERIHTENSYKFTMHMICSILQNAGFSVEQSWFDEKKWFGLHLARVHS